MNSGCDKLHDKEFTAEQISSFSIIEKKGKKILHVLLKAGKEIEITIADHVFELHGILSEDPAAHTIITQIINRSENEYKKSQQKENADFLLWLDLPENLSIKLAYGVNDDSIHQFFERMNIKNNFLKSYVSTLPFDYHHLPDLVALRDLLKIVDAKAQGLFTPVSKILGISSHEAESQYRSQDIVSKEWIHDHLTIIEKLFTVFERSAFPGQNPIPYSQRHADEKNLLLQQLKSFGTDESVSEKISEQKKDEIESEEIKIFDTSNAALKQLGLEDELKKLFSEGSNIDRRYYFSRYYQENDIPEECLKLVKVSREIYKKLRLLGLYYQGELKIGTQDGLEIFTGSEMSRKSIDGKLYYKDHEEKYADDNRGKFFFGSG